MKRFNKSVVTLLTLLTLGFVGAGCGSKDDDNNQNSGGGGSSSSTIVHQAYAGGPATIYFTANNVYNSGVVLSVGQVLTQANYFTDSFLGRSWLFANNNRSGGSGSISLYNGQLGSQSGQNVLSGYSQIDSGTRLTMTVQPGSDQLHQNVVYGQLDISASYIQRVYGGVMPNVIGLTIDVGVYGNYTLTQGGILIYTSQDQSGYHGSFLAF